MWWLAYLFVNIGWRTWYICILYSFGRTGIIGPHWVIWWWCVIMTKQGLENSPQWDSRFSRILENFLQISLLVLDLGPFQFHFQFHFSKKKKWKDYFFTSQKMWKLSIFHPFFSRKEKNVKNSREFSLLDLDLNAFGFHFSLLGKEWKHIFFHFALFEKEWKHIFSLFTSRTL